MGERPGFATRAVARRDAADRPGHAERRRSSRPRRTVSTPPRNTRRRSRSARPATRTRAATGTPPCRPSSPRWPRSRAPRRRSGSPAAWRRSTRWSRLTRRPGDRVVISNELYGGTYSIATKVLPRFGVRGRHRRPARPRGGAGGPPRGGALLHRDDREPQRDGGRSRGARATLCREAGVPRAVDNTFASPYLCTPAAFGFEYVIHSATKYLGGHHDLIGGVVCYSSEGRARLRDIAIDTGGTMAPFEAWLCLRGLMTLALRMDRHGATATALAEMLEAHREGRARPLPGTGVAPAARGRPEGAPARRSAG